jgi:chromatin remodeling complex protein RSC6
MARTSSRDRQERGDGRKRSAGALARPVRPDEKLAEIVGAEAQPRTELTKRVWDYIRTHNLQDTVDRRMINADAKLAEVLDGKQKVSMFELTKLVNKHVQA